MEKVQHIVHEAYGDYIERKSSGNFILYIFGGACLGILGLILLGFSTGIVDRIVFILMIIGGVWIMIRNTLPSRKPRYRDTAHRISYG